MGRFPSGQRGQTVNLLSYDFDGSNPSLPIFFHAEVAQLVEQHLDMVEVVGSSPIPRIIFVLAAVAARTFLFLPTSGAKNKL